MALRLSTGLRNGMMGTSTLKELLENGTIDIYSGIQPASADSVETGSKLVTISSTSGTAAADGVKFGTAAGVVLGVGAIPWSGLCKLAGIAGYFRFRGSGGTAGSSTVEKRMDGNVGVSGADLNLTHTSLSLNTTITIPVFDITQPAE